MVSSTAIKQWKFNNCLLFAHIVCSIWPIDRNLSGATTLGQSEPGSNGNEGELHIPQIIIQWFDIIFKTLVGGTPYRDAVCVFNSPQMTGLFTIKNDIVSN